jgi:outer membrane protein assembly factor BamA
MFIGAVRRLLSAACLLPAACCLLPAALSAQSEIGRYDGRAISGVEIVFEDTPPDEATSRELLALLPLAARGEYTAVKGREALQSLFSSRQVAAARLEITEAQNARPNRNGPAVALRFVVRRSKRVSDISFNVAIPKGAPLNVAEMRARLTALEPGGRVSDKLLGDNADALQEYLRERGFFRAEVSYKLIPDARDQTGARERVIFSITPGSHAEVSEFAVDIKGIAPEKLAPAQRRFLLKTNAYFTRDALNADIRRLRAALIAEGYLAPLLEDPKVEYDPETDRIRVRLTGRVGPQVKVELENLKLSKKTQTRLLPIKREGTIDPSAIVEGERRLKTKLQLDGYFFAEVFPVCSISPDLPDNAVRNGTRETCDLITPEEVADRNVTVTYQVEKGRRYKVDDIRIVGLDKSAIKLRVEDIEPELRTQRANPLAFADILGSRRGFTSDDFLKQDADLVRARMRDLGYRDAKVSVRQGVSIKGETLVLTFAIRPNALTRVKAVKFKGNTVFDEFKLRQAVAEAGRARCAERELALLQGRSTDELPCYPTLEGSPYSRSQARADGEAAQKLYADNGYFDARISFELQEETEKTPDGDALVTLIYNVFQEGRRVEINDVSVLGNNRVKIPAVLRAVPLRSGDLLRADRLTESERNLYGTDAFRQINVNTRRVGERPDGAQLRDVVIELEEDKLRNLEYGGGYSTDTGPLGFVSIRNVNLFGNLWQGAARTRVSQRQQLVRLDFLDPRWRGYGENRFMPLSLSAQYQRDSTVTRFFRSTVDRGSFGIVQRLNANGQPVDEFGRETGVPTINRFTFNAETQRVLDKKSHNIILARYAYEDVRLYQIGSLLIADILRPDQVVRLSRLGASFYRDTRDNQFEPTKGEYLSLEYNISLRQLGGNISFNKFQFDYRRYLRLKKARNTMLAGNFTLGLANIINPRDRNGRDGVDETDRQLPISERFFGGGSTNLRGFGFEEAGPRLIAPNCYTQPGLNDQQRIACAAFLDRRGNTVRLNPFTVPVGGNALAFLNLEARVPFTKQFQIVPFYDGGNIYRSVKDLFGGDSSGNPNLRQRWTHTAGLGFRVKTPFGGSFAVDYGFLLNPPKFVIPQIPSSNPDAVFRLRPGQIHFRFTQAF